MADYSTQICIVGGGPTGLAAAVQAAEDGADTKRKEELYTNVLWMLAELAYREKMMPEQLLSERIADKIDYFEAQGE